MSGDFRVDRPASRQSHPVDVTYERLAQFAMAASNPSKSSEHGPQARKCAVMPG